MKRATRDGLKKALAPYYTMQDGFITMSEEDAEKAAEIVNSTYSGVYCSTTSTKVGTQIFSVISFGKTHRTYFEAAIR